MLIDEFRADWIAEGRASTTAQEYARVLARWGITDEPPSASFLREHIARRLQEVSSQTVLYECRAMKAYSRWYAELMDEPDVLAKVKYPKAHAPAPQKIADDAAIDALLSRFEAKTVLRRNAEPERTSFETARLRLLVTMLRDTGMRRGEAAKLNVADIDLQQRTLLVRQPKSVPAENRADQCAATQRAAPLPRSSSAASLGAPSEPRHR